MMRDLARDVAVRMPCAGEPAAPLPAGLGAPRVAYLTDLPPRLLPGGRVMADVAREIAAQMPAWDATGVAVG
jgi:hypothetical protein